MARLKPCPSQNLSEPEFQPSETGQAPSLHEFCCSLRSRALAVSGSPYSNSQTALESKIHATCVGTFLASRAWHPLFHRQSPPVDSAGSRPGQLRDPGLLLGSDAEERHHGGNPFQLHRGRL